jgi:hypothetical protein
MSIFELPTKPTFERFLIRGARLDFSNWGEVFGPVLHPTLHDMPSASAVDRGFPVMSFDTSEVRKNRARTNAGFQ